jgi:hypothetical protein
MMKKRIEFIQMFLKMEYWRVCRPVVADTHHFDEEKDPDPLFKGTGRDPDRSIIKHIKQQ